MFDDSAMGVRLAWVELLAWTKAHGRAGRVRLRDKAFAKQRRLTEEAVSEMLDRASSGPKPAIKRQGDEIVILNWRRYQDPKARSINDLSSNGSSFSKTSENDATRDQRPETNHQPPKDQGPERSGSGGSGVSKAGKGEDLTNAALRDPAAFRRWVERERALPHGLVQSDADEQLALAAREKAIRDDTLRRPVGWLKDTLRLRAWDRVRDDHEDAARATEREATGPPAELVNGIFKPAIEQDEEAAIAKRREQILRQLRT